MKNKITLLRSYTSMLAFDLLSWGACGEDWSKLRSVSRQIYKHLKGIYGK